MPGGTVTTDQILTELRMMHGDVKVALDRTVSLTAAQADLNARVGRQELDIAKAKGAASTVGTIAGIVSALIVSFAKSMFGGHAGS